MEVNSSRKRSPRAPSISLEEAVDRVRNVYDVEGSRAAPTEAVAQHMGYKGANNGAALQALASAKYFGLLEKPEDGRIRVTEGFEQFLLAREEVQRKSRLVQFLRNPPLYAELLARYKKLTTSTDALRSDLIKRGFNPIAAEVALAAFLKSVEYADYSSNNGASSDVVTLSTDLTVNSDNGVTAATALSDDASGRTSLAAGAFASLSPVPTPLWLDAGMDSIPVRLPGGRKAWLAIPTPFYADDKQRLKAQIDLLLTQEQG
ncbi:hypothetical protein [Allopusillimonas ginsengisoli]|uniref:hypothetical protein n=1 Tax=Allopusillimonas ginsengisoli TaxID=453575 RepID=UPI00101EC705|nr:hypothetical protein [Allopusillimonas ginsengisoli]TEA79925.1 hypothetical protein ERE07_03045 [Allopusillimonas ginsengisoli]